MEEGRRYNWLRMMQAEEMAEESRRYSRFKMMQTDERQRKAEDTVGLERCKRRKSGGRQKIQLA